MGGASADVSHYPLSDVTAELETAAEGGATIAGLAQLLRARAPELVVQIEADARQPELMGAWGLSANRDPSQPELAITHPAILSAIGILAGGVDMGGEAVHAGLMHTYGYLLSNLETPFGFKHERYTEGSIAKALGLEPHDLLSPSPPRGTLLSNLTEVVHQVTAPESGLAVDRFIEHAPASDLTIQTDLVAFPNPDEVKGTHLLIYSLRLGEAPRRRITAFPAEPWVRGKLIDRAKNASGRDDTPIRLRYNARLPDGGGLTFVGSISFGSGV